MAKSKKTRLSLGLTKLGNYNESYLGLPLESESSRIRNSDLVFETLL